MRVDSFDATDVDSWCDEVGGERGSIWSRMGSKMESCKLDDGTEVGARDSGDGPFITIENDNMDGVVQMKVEDAHFGISEHSEESYMWFGETTDGTDGFMYYGYDETADF